MRKTNKVTYTFDGQGCLLAALSIFIVTSAAWLQHVVTCLQGEQWGFLIAGALMFPIAVIHGIGVWIGVF